jgi:protein-arginine kinase activator protein McsA
MKIKKHGKTYEKEPKDKTEKFTCENCECEFVAKEDEYYVDLGGADQSSITTDTVISTTWTYSYMTNDYLVCSCPECHKIVKKIRKREQKVGCPTVTYDNVVVPCGCTTEEPSSITWTCEDALNEALTGK